MVIRITYFGGRTEEFSGVGYVSAYTMSTPQIMRIEFVNSIQPALTVELTTVENFVTLIRATK